METLEEEKLQSTTTYDRLVKKKKAKVSVPTEIIEEIVLRLPVRSILRFRSVSKPWLSRISDPSFTKLHSTRATTAFFISGYDHSTRKRYFFTAGRDGGPVTHLITLDDDSYFTSAKHLNGLVLFACLNQAFVVNPSMHKFFKIPVLDSLTNYSDLCFSFGFDESRNEHKILHINMPETPAQDTAKIMIFSMSRNSWREIEVNPPAGYGWDQLYNCDMSSVCVNSVVHFMLPCSVTYILAFDLRSEMFSVISIIPEGVLLRDDVEAEPYIIKINGCLGVCHDHMEEHSEMDLWILQDYENRVWVRETITFPKPCIELDCRFPVNIVDSVNMDGIIISSRKSSENVLSVPFYNRKTGCFKSLQFTWDHQFPIARSLWFSPIRCYAESMVPL